MAMPMVVPVAVPVPWSRQVDWAPTEVSLSNW